MASLHEEEDDHNITDERKEYGAEGRFLSEPQKAHLTGEFVIVAKPEWWKQQGMRSL